MCECKRDMLFIRHYSARGDVAEKERMSYCCRGGYTLTL